MAFRSSTPMTARSSGASRASEARASEASDRWHRTENATSGSGASGARHHGRGPWRIMLRTPVVMSPEGVAGGPPHDSSTEAAAVRPGALFDAAMDVGRERHGCHDAPTPITRSRSYPWADVISP
jgi:hypothetical protein